jgi:asparagine synthetase B (glutamine-hydrolysing)
MLGCQDPNFGWVDGTLLTGTGWEVDPIDPAALRGAFTGVVTGDGGPILIRDPLGINKLFWAARHPEDIWVAARPCRLTEAGCAFEDLRAVPPGSSIELEWKDGAPQARATRATSRLRRDGRNGLPVEEIAFRVRSTLERYCAALAKAHHEAQVFVCLSGGLDSSGVVILARRHFRHVTAVSFDLERNGEPPSADRTTAQRLARDFRLPLLTVTVSVDRLLEGLDLALTEGIDWRDFNVHAALVNVALARGIAETRAASDPDASALVLTGDLANEYLCDYQAETYRGRIYYRLPRLAPAALQELLVRGVETSHREIGPFQAWDLPVVQVYAPVVDHYLQLPESFLCDPQRKERLNRLVFPNEIPEYVYARPKTRAQVGDAESGRGVLAACVDRGIDEAWLRRRFAELHRITDPAALQRFMRAGRYRYSPSRIMVP